MIQTKFPTPDYIVTLPPPTPNGGLHVGHMAGPFLAADIFTKAVQANDKQVHVLSFSDTNQSYVRATAEKQNRDPQELASYWTKDILKTLDVFGCQVDNYFEPDEVSNSFVLDIVLSLYEKGTIKKKPYPFMYNLDQGTFLDEAGVSGLCPRCLDDCKCGICESCGFPTRADTLINPRATNDPTTRIEVRYVEVLTLELENWRNQIRKFHTFSDAIRPKYRWLVDDALDDLLPDFPITVPGTWGIKADHPDCPGQVVNAWPELVLNFVYGYRKVITPNTPAPKIVNFFGFDNSYFYALVHVALLYATKLEEFLPHATIINEFYNLDNAKFSTSRGHVVWAQDLVKDLPADIIRFYCALTAPGFEQSNCNLLSMKTVIEERLSEPLMNLMRWLNERLPDIDQIVGVSPLAQKFRNIIVNRVAYGLSVGRFNLQHCTNDILHSLALILSNIESSKVESKNQQFSDVLYLLESWCQAAAPIMPVLTKELISNINCTRNEFQPLNIHLFSINTPEKQNKLPSGGYIGFTSRALDCIESEMDWVKIFENNNYLIEYWKPIGPDTQTPHEEDEYYFITKGRTAFLLEKEKYILSAGDIIFVPKHVEHRFVEQSHDLELWIIFIRSKS